MPHILWEMNIDHHAFDAMNRPLHALPPESAAIFTGP